MIDLLGFLYEVGKDLKAHYERKEEEKLVELSWVQKSGFDKAAADKRYTIAWSRHDKVESRKLDGFDVMFELDKTARIRRKLVTRDGLVLLGKKV